MKRVEYIDALRGFTMLLVVYSHIIIWGYHTIDFPSYHYFFLPRNLEIISNFFKNYNNPIIEFVLTMILSIIVTCITLVVSEFIRLSPFLARNLFGAKSDFNKCDNQL